MALKLTSETITAKYRAAQVPNSRSTDAVQSTPRFQNKVALPQPVSRFEQATEVTLSPTAQAAQKGSERAARALSNATSYVDLADNAVAEISSLLSKAKSSASALEKEVDPTKRSQLAEESAALLAEIDNVIEDAELNENPVFNAGTRSFTFDLKQERPTGDSTYTFAISNFELSRSTLDVDALNASTIDADSEAAVDAIEAAEQQLVVTRFSVEKSKETINTVAEEFGISSAQDFRAKRQISAQESIILADKIAESIQNSVVEATNAQDVNAQQVEPLLEDEEQAPRANRDRQLVQAEEEGTIF